MRLTSGAKAESKGDRLVSGGFGWVEQPYGALWLTALDRSIPTKLSEIVPTLGLWDTCPVVCETWFFFTTSSDEEADMTSGSGT